MKCLKQATSEISFSLFLQSLLMCYFAFAAVKFCSSILRLQQELSPIHRFRSYYAPPRCIQILRGLSFFWHLIRLFLSFYPFENKQLQQKI